jgi:hypothetical protein
VPFVAGTDADSADVSVAAGGAEYLVGTDIFGRATIRSMEATRTLTEKDQACRTDAPKGVIEASGRGSQFVRLFRALDGKAIGGPHDFEGHSDPRTKLTLIGASTRQETLLYRGTEHPHSASGLRTSGHASDRASRRKFH